MWSKDDQMFENIDSATGKFVRIKAWTNFTPLYAGIAKPEQANATIQKHLLNPDEFWSANGVRSVSQTEDKYFDADNDGWAGPVWVISNYLMMHGLMNYGHQAEAMDLANKTVHMLIPGLESPDGMNEAYNPDTGKPLAGKHFVSWDLLSEHMIQEAATGSDPTAMH